jgi:hypothetical protein
MPPPGRHHGKKNPTGDMWTMKADRELIALSKTKSLEAIADHFQRPPALILAKAKRLGLSIKRDRAKRK